MPKWISVKDRLPNADETVLITLDADGTEPRETAIDTLMPNGRWHGYMDEYVTHWQPLPPPAGEDK